MTAKRHVPKFAKREKLSNKRKFALLLAAVFLLTLPFLAAANSSLLQSVVSPLITQVQNVFSPAEPSSAVLGSDFSPASSSDLPPEALAISGGMNHTMAIRGDGTLWSWGRNISGRTGLDIDVGEQTTPAQVGTATNWSYVVAGNFQTHAIKDDGTLWSWGGNRDAATGLGTTVGAQWTPMQVGSDTDWTSVTAGQFHSHALKTDGTLWTWGLNAQGRNGMGLLTGSQLTPVQVGSDTNWKQVSAGGNHSLAVRLDGTLWSWGSNNFGVTGLGTVTGNQITPIQIGSDTDWLQVCVGWEHSLAVKTDGTIWAWGRNQYGRTGLGIVAPTNTLVPTQVGSDTDWVQVSAGQNHSHAIKADGTLWSWGWNNGGQTGLADLPYGTAFNQPVPAQVGTATDWALVSAGSNFGFGLKTNGDLWGWGWNTDGQLGLGHYNERTVPVLIWGNFIPPEVAVIATMPPPDATGINETNTTHLDVFFDSEMDPTVMGTVTLTNGAFVDLTQKSWRASTASDPYGDIGDNSVLTAPLTLFASDALHEVTVADFICAPNGEPMIPHSWTFTTGTVIPPAPAPTDLAITKHLQMPVGTITPDTEFAFEITAYSFNNETAQASVLPTITVPNLTFSPSDVATVTGDVRTVTQVSDLLIGDMVLFPSPGLFTYRISERNDTFSNTTTETMTFDPTIYQVTFIVLPDSETGENYVSAILVQEVLPGDVLGSKLEDLYTALTFTNTFVRSVEIDPTDPLAVGGLRISKTTTGIMPDFSRAFDFDIRLSAPSLATTITPPIIYRAQIINTETNVPVGPIIEFTDEVTRTVALTHNQTLVFLDTHVGARYTAVELPVSDYTPNVVVHADGVIDMSIINPPERTPNVALSTGEQTLGEDINAADFTNTDYFVPPTGLDIGKFGLALLLAAIAALIVIVTATRRSKREMELQVL